jgi:hypothetical protein
MLTVRMCSLLLINIIPVSQIKADLKSFTFCVTVEVNTFTPCYTSDELYFASHCIEMTVISAQTEYSLIAVIPSFFFHGGAPKISFHIPRKPCI